VGGQAECDRANRLVAAGAAVYTWIETSEMRSVVLILLFSAALTAQSGGAVVSGRVLDPDGQPVARAQVQLLSATYTLGSKYLVLRAAATTNALGEYRLVDLPARQYYLNATDPSGTPIYGVAEPPEGSAASEPVYATTYYPGVTDFAAAVPLDVPAGGRLLAIDVRLIKAQTARVRGRLLSATDVQIASVELVPRDLGVPAPKSASSRAGAFEVRGVAPGRYFLVASARDGEGAFLSGRVPIEVGEQNLENVSVALFPLIGLSGTIRVEGAGPGLPPALHLMLAPREKGAIFHYGGLSVDPIPIATVHPDGSFRIEDAYRDAYVVQVDVPQVYVKSFQVAGVEQPVPVLDLTHGAAGDVALVLARDLPTINGTVLDPQTGQPAPHAEVALVPQEPERRDLTYFYPWSRSDASGQFHFSGPPGRYKAFAWLGIETMAYIAPDFLRPFESQGVPVEASPGASLNIRLKALRPETGGR
jgi:hypothetical protein